MPWGASYPNQATALPFGFASQTKDHEVRNIDNARSHWPTATVGGTDTRFGLPYGPAAMPCVRQAAQVKSAASKRQRREAGVKMQAGLF